MYLFLHVFHARALARSYYPMIRIGFVEICHYSDSRDRKTLCHRVDLCTVYVMVISYIAFYSLSLNHHFMRSGVILNDI